jgi:hypothetical protein
MHGKRNRPSAWEFAESSAYFFAKKTECNFGVVIIFYAQFHSCPNYRQSATENDAFTGVSGPRVAYRAQHHPAGTSIFLIALLIGFLAIARCSALKPPRTWRI